MPGLLSQCIPPSPSPTVSTVFSLRLRLHRRPGQVHQDHLSRLECVFSDALYVKVTQEEWLKNQGNNTSSVFLWCFQFLGHRVTGRSRKREKKSLSGWPRIDMEGKLTAHTASPRTKWTSHPVLLHWKSVFWPTDTLGNSLRITLAMSDISIGGNSEKFYEMILSLTENASWTF